MSLRTISAPNLHVAFESSLHLLNKSGATVETAKGTVRMIPNPVVIDIQKPTERVSLWKHRQINPFLSLFEAIGVLRCSNSVQLSMLFGRDIKELSDDGRTINGAYGFRAGTHFGVDQVQVIAGKLNSHPPGTDCVLTLWDPACDLSGGSKNIPSCTQVCFRRDIPGKLQMMVMNRSGELDHLLGYELVKLSFVQEMIASLIRCAVGSMTVITNDLHCFTQTHQLFLDGVEDLDGEDLLINPYAQLGTCPLMSIQPGRWARELATFFTNPYAEFQDQFINGVLRPMWESWHVFRDLSPTRHQDSLELLKPCTAADWKLACMDWIEADAKRLS